jgi:hypothetical protein
MRVLRMKIFGRVEQKKDSSNDRMNIYSWDDWSWIYIYIYIPSESVYFTMGSKVNSYYSFTCAIEIEICTTFNVLSGSSSQTRCRSLLKKISYVIIIRRWFCVV